MRHTSSAARWRIMAGKILLPEVCQAILDCAEAIAQSRGADALGLVHLQRALDWLVLDK